MRITSDFKTHFMASVNKTRSCWMWTRCKGPNGYGQFYYKGSTYGAHRASLIANGVSIPKGMCVDHVCRNRMCVNPRHLRVVTYQQNAVENSQSISAFHAAKTHCLRGHPFDERNTLRTFSGGKNRRVCRQCALIRVVKFQYLHGMSKRKPIVTSDKPKRRKT